MKYTYEERLSIGEEIYTHQITHQEAMEKYKISKRTAEDYVCVYKKSIGIPFDRHDADFSNPELKVIHSKNSNNPELEEYMAMSKEELIKELVIAKANELRAKKGYEVKGAGANKEFIPINNKNTKS